MFPRLVQIGSFSLPTYGALVAIAFLVALWLTSRFAKERGVSSEKVVNLGVYCALTGMLGAKILMIAMDPEYRLHPEEIFTRETLQRNIRQPLETVGYQDRMDVIARLQGGGISAQAGALRHGVSRALLEADPNLRGELKRRGFLTRDPRVKERKKAGLKKARKRPQFSKR